MENKWTSFNSLVVHKILMYMFTLLGYVRPLVVVFETSCSYIHSILWEQFTEESIRAIRSMLFTEAIALASFSHLYLCTLPLTGNCGLPLAAQSAFYTSIRVRGQKDSRERRGEGRWLAGTAPVHWARGPTGLWSLNNGAKYGVARICNICNMNFIVQFHTWQ